MSEKMKPYALITGASRENKIVALRKAINDGTESGRAVDFDAKKHLDILKARRKSNG
jgi:antitoxin ParD1/3/4